MNNDLERLWKRLNLGIKRGYADVVEREQKGIFCRTIQNQVTVVNCG